MQLRQLFVAFILVLLSRSAFADRTLEHDAVVAAPLAEVWSIWTTGEGFKTLGVAKAEVDLRIGGDIRSSYNPQSNLQDEHTIINRIISFEPQRMLSIQNVQAPKGFKNAELFQKTWSVVYLTPRSPNSTHVRIVNTGYGEGPEWDDLYRKFDAGNKYTLDTLRKKFGAKDAKASHTPDETMKLLGTLVGGDWIYENTRPDGTIFRARNLYEFGPDGRSLCAQSWLGTATGMAPHGVTQIWVEPALAQGQSPGPVRFQSINEKGAVARGEIRHIAPNQLEWDWVATELDGTALRYRIDMMLKDQDSCHFLLFLVDQDGGGEPKELVNFTYKRVHDLPPAFAAKKADS